jgi:hypothetical protein
MNERKIMSEAEKAIWIAQLKSAMDNQNWDGVAEVIKSMKTEVILPKAKNQDECLPGCRCKTGLVNSSYCYRCKPKHVLRADHE